MNSRKQDFNLEKGAADKTSDGVQVFSIGSEKTGFVKCVDYIPGLTDDELKKGETSRYHPSKEQTTGCGCFGLFKVRVCAPSQYLIKTGLGVNELVPKTKCVQWPYQRVCVIDILPRNYKFYLEMKSAELVPFKLPAVFTIGPVEPWSDLQGSLVYARRMSGLTELELAEVIAGVVHGQTRVYCSGLTIRDIFDNQDDFRAQVQMRIQKDVDCYGLLVYNTSFGEMMDLDQRNRPVEKMKQKAVEESNAKPVVQVPAKLGMEWTL